MKTTIELSDALLAEVRSLAEQEHTTLRALIEEGLRTVVARKKRPRAFRLRKASFAGEGLQRDLPAERWDVLRDLAYEGRGG